MSATEDGAAAESIVAQLERRVANGLAGTRVQVSGDGGRFQIEVVGECFAGASRVKRQQLVYACIDELIQSGAVHAVTIRAQTPAENAA